MKKIILIIFILFLISCSTVKVPKDVTHSEEKKEKIQIDDSEIENVLVQAGSNKQGSLDYDFYIGKYEITHEKFEKIMGYNPSFFKGENLPVEQVTWYDALFFCNKLSELEGLVPYYSIKEIKRNKESIVYANIQINKESKGYRLPTQIEWRYAAAGGNKSLDYKYSGSNNISDVAWYKENSGGKTSTAGKKKPNELGIFDMSGNVYEWGESNYRIEQKQYKILLGGSWGDVEEFSRIKENNADEPENKSKYTGFRIAKTK